MKKVSHYLRLLYTLWGVACFWMGMLLVYPFLLVIIQREQWHKYAYPFNRFWAWCTYIGILMPAKIVYKTPLDKRQKYVFCPNHNSYLDIPLVGMSAPHFVVFIGKSSLAKVPIFGYQYRKLHIIVDRENRKSKYLSFELAKQAVIKGHSVCIFPEGKINEEPPVPCAFKEGAFRLAIEQQIPIVPVTIPYQWMIFSDVQKLLKWHKIKIIYHEPIPTIGLTMADADNLREKVYDIISNELKLYFPEKFEQLLHEKNESR